MQVILNFYQYTIIIPRFFLFVKMEKNRCSRYPAVGCEMSELQVKGCGDKGEQLLTIS